MLTSPISRSFFLLVIVTVVVTILSFTWSSIGVVAFTTLQRHRHNDVTASLSTGIASLFHRQDIYHPTPADVQAFLGDSIDLASRPSTSSLLVDVRRAVLQSAHSFVQYALNQLATSDELAQRSTVGSDATEYPYWRFVPRYVGTLTPDQPAITWSAPCFQQNSGRLTPVAGAGSGDNTTAYTVTLTLENPVSLLCSDMYLFATLEGLTTQTYLLRGEQTFTWQTAANATAAELYDVARKGIRVFVFTDSAADTLTELSTTIDLFASELTQGVSADTAKLNVDFMAKYPQFKMVPRSIEQVAINQSEIHSGDFFGIVRLDGLDPMLAWAMGAHTGHTTMALWIGNELYVCESTTNSTYWPVNGVQRTPFAKWLEQAHAAGYQVVHAPLNDEARALFNETAALEFFDSVEGLDYGYQTMLWSWIDTVQDNLPCLPPEYSLCLTPAHMQVIFGWIDRTIPTVGSMLYQQAWNKRVGASGLSFAEVLQRADEIALDPAVLPTIVEEDSWLYETTRYGEPTVGPAMVCCMFVCRMWKAAGVFGALTDSINCSEQTNSDLYALSILQAPAQRPDACIAADPANPLCQLDGAYTLVLNPFAVRAPYAHLDESCPSLAPNYTRIDGC